MMLMTAAIREALFQARLFFLHILFREGCADMMAMFFAQRVILGKTAYADVPTKLKPAVADLLDDAGLGDLAKE
jgi:hypothetical protein